ncbi:hypothetical protein SteCoe_16503 [Stentor coeruleus]|uniref:PPM-type phosphatase domain-containing protein n=1 Tax=Stentor coeruleus TaxID=5963 RepID=A0A1R2C1B7_9CILI|nr:hypothetical protein SteCoe_16503 [Stentor coeruleus]
MKIRHPASKSAKPIILTLRSSESSPAITKATITNIPSKIAHFKSRNFSQSNLAQLLQSPQSNYLKPIQTIKALHKKPSSSNRPSPNKLIPRKKLTFLSPAADLSTKVNKPQIESSIRKPTKRRTHSMECDILESTNNHISRCLYKTRIGSINGENKKQNQDSFIIKNNFLGIYGNYFFSVCDGHGLHGHLVSRFIKLKLPEFLENSIFQYQSSLENTDNSTLNDGVLIEKSYSLAIKNLEKNLKTEDFDTDFSGTTAVSIIILGKIIVCGNIGDSRAVLGRKTFKWDSKDLSRDHKPDLQSEKTRIDYYGGRIFPYFNTNGAPVGPLRVWLKDTSVPGIAMSRSIGDNVAASVGVISEPEFLIHNIKKEDRFIIIASDGLWEFITSKEAVDIVGLLIDEGNSHLACESLVNEAVKRWNENDGTVDDVTVLVVFFNV